MPKIKTIGVDLDTPSVFDLLREYLKAEILFPKAVKRVYSSSSGKGFHIEIDRQTEPLYNFYYRALLNDDPVRLRYSMQKYVLGETWNDILFDLKNKKPRKQIPLDKLLAKHKKKVSKIKQEWGTKKSENLLEKLSVLLEKNFEKIREYVAVITLSSDVELLALKALAEERGVRYRVFRNYFPGEEKFIFSCTFSEKEKADDWAILMVQTAYGKVWVKEL